MLNISFSVLSQICLLGGLSILGFQLLNDPWMYERFQRLIRENCRINNKLLDYEVHDYVEEIRHFIAITLLFFTAGSFLRIDFMRKTLAAVFAIFSLLVWNPTMIVWDEKFCPVLFGIVSIATILNIWDEGTIEKMILVKQRQVQVQAKSKKE